MFYHIIPSKVIKYSIRMLTKEGLKFLMINIKALQIVFIILYYRSKCAPQVWHALLKCRLYLRPRI